jgi:CBS domain-containing protein
MKASDVMTPGVVTVSPDTKVPEIAALLLERRISAVAVVERNGNVSGVVSESDLMRRPEIGTDGPRWRWLQILLSPEDRERDFVKTHGLKARDVMTKPAVSVAPDASLPDVVHLMGRRSIKRVLVLDNGRLVGIVTRTDLLRALHARKALTAPSVPPDDRALREAILRALSDSDWADRAIVNVQVAEGQVELWGAIESEAQREAIRVAVEGVPGVRGITEHYAQTRAG